MLSRLNEMLPPSTWEDVWHITRDQKPIGIIIPVVLSLVRSMPENSEWVTTNVLAAEATYN